MFPLSVEPKGSSGSASPGAVSGSMQPVGGLFQGGVPKLRPVGGKLPLDDYVYGVLY